MNKIVEDLEENFRNKRGCQEHDPGLIISYKIKIDTEYFGLINLKLPVKSF